MFIEFLLFLALLWILHIQKLRRLPQGPFSLPLLGTLDLYTSNKSIIEVFFQKKYWDRYKDFCTYFLGPSRFVISINNFQLAKELFNKDEFSGRGVSWWLQNIRGTNGRSLGIINTEGNVWSEQRRFALKHLKNLGFGRKALDSAMVEEADIVIDKLIEQSQKDENVEIKNNFNTAIINVLWQIVASKRFDVDHPDTQKLMEQLNCIFKNAPSKRRFLGDYEKYLPFRDVDIYTLEMKSMIKTLITEHLQDIDYDNPRDFIDMYLTEMKNDSSNFDEDHLIVMCLDFFQAGAETTSTTLLWAVMFMVLNPTIQEECQKEIMDKIGTRPPLMDDMPNLSYIIATLMEIQRISLVAPGSLQHKLKSDTVVGNYTFRKGTMFFVNLSKFMSDPNEFPDPECFNPKRFLEEDGKIKKFEQFVPFGMGKRICMGMSLSQNELFLFFVRIMQRISFKESPLQKPNTNDVIFGITRIPKPFTVNIILN